MKLSIAVPSLNYARYLDSCLSSFCAQSHPDFEVLIADGGSRDGSVEIAERHAGSDPRLRIVSRNDRGQADAVQRAFALSRGEIFGFLNADDAYLDNDALAKVAQAFERDPALDVVSFGGYYIDGAGRRLRRVRLRYHPLDRVEWIRFRPSVLQPATFWRRAVQTAVPLRTDLHYVFDAWFFYEVHARFNWREFPDPIVEYRLHGSNKSRGVSPARVRELASFEAFKFGPASFRARYLGGVAGLVASVEGRPLGRAVKRAVYVAVNSLSFASAYRLPGI